MKVGDRVELTLSNPTTFDLSKVAYLNKGEKGTIKHIHDSRHIFNIVVEFDNEFRNAMQCGFMTKAGHGWYCNEDQLKVIETEKVESDNKLLKQDDYPYTLDQCIKFIDHISIEGIAGGINQRIGGMALCISKFLDELKNFKMTCPECKDNMTPVYMCDNSNCGNVIVGTKNIENQSILK